jgi:hypothetical protein
MAANDYYSMYDWVEMSIAQLAFVITRGNVLALININLSL